MALSGSLYSSTWTGETYWGRLYFYWTATQNVANNTSTISWSISANVGKNSGGNSGWITFSELSVKINNESVYYRSASNHTNCSNGTSLASGTKTLTHNSDGTCTFSVSIGAGIYNYSINKTGSSTFTLNTIARASSIDAAWDGVLGGTCGIKWTPASSSFKFKLKFVLGNWNYTTGIISPNTTSQYLYNSYTIPLEAANQIPNATSGTMTVYLYTYSDNGSTQIGSTASKTFSVAVPNSAIPTISSVTASIVNSNSVINGWGVAVAGYTKVKVDASASGVYSSTIKSFAITDGYSATVNGSSLSYTGSAISSSGNKTFTVKATDSRGRVSSAKSSSAITFYAYSKPTVSSFSVARSSSNAQQIVVKANWSYASVNSKNSATAKLYYKRSTASSWTQYGDITSSKNTNLTLSGVTFNEAYSYNFKVVVTDALSNNAQEEAFVSTIEVLMDFKAGGKGLGIGKIAETDNLEVALNSVFIGDVYIKVGNTNVPLVTYIKNAVNGDYD